MMTSLVLVVLTANPSGAKFAEALSLRDSGKPYQAYQAFQACAAAEPDCVFGLAGVVDAAGDAKRANELLAQYAKTKGQFAQEAKRLFEARRHDGQAAANGSITTHPVWTPQSLVSFEPKSGAVPAVLWVMEQSSAIDACFKKTVKTGSGVTLEVPLELLATGAQVGRVRQLGGMSSGRPPPKGRTLTKEEAQQSMQDAMKEQKRMTEEISACLTSAAVQWKSPAAPAKVELSMSLIDAPGFDPQP